MTASLIFADGRVSRWRATRRFVVSGMAALGLVVTASCNEKAVPFFAAPTSVPNSQVGIQDAVTGLIGAMRPDQFSYLLFTSSFARDALLFLAVDAPYASIYGGQQRCTPNYCDNVWTAEFRNALQANQMIASLPHVPGYSAPQVAAITGVVQTMKALNFMYLAEIRDTVGIPIYSIVKGTASAPYCNQDVWKYIVALLDSGFADLNTAGPIALPVALPAGFASVGATAAPSTTPGAFAAFNRALAGKAGLELAYAMARNSPGTSPTPTTPGAPYVPALTRADSALTASALYDLSAIAPPIPGPFPLDAHGVYYTFSGASGDHASPLNIYYPDIYPLADLVADVDTAHDMRWHNKFVPTPTPIQLTQYDHSAVQASFLPYATPSGSVPIVRAEELALVRAEIQLGLGNYANAISLINVVHQQAGGFATPLSIAQSYTAVRDTLMKEMRISTVLEGSGDHLLAIRMWGMASVSDTTWQATSGPDALADAAIVAVSGPLVDLHTTLPPVPTAEVQGRGGRYAPVCP